jgi:TetR/AcrR family transcriptional regulator
LQVFQEWAFGRTLSAVSTQAAARLDPRRQKTIDRLVEAAEELFGDAPLEAVTVEQIGARAGVAVGSIYNNFGSKAGLYAAVVDRALDVDRRYMDRAYRADRAPVDQLMAAAAEYLHFALEHPAFFRLLAFPPPLGAHPSAAEAADRLARRVDEQNARMAGAIERGIGDGTLKPVDPRRAATVLWASWNGIASLAWRPDALREDEASLAELVRLATELLSFGLRCNG